MKAFQALIDVLHEHLLLQYPSLKGREHLLARMVKLQEETGELAQSLLQYYGLQRKEKLQNNQLQEQEEKSYLQNIQQEIADVIITAGLIGKMCNLNVEDILNEKKAQLLQRIQKEELERKNKE